MNKDKPILWLNNIVLFGTFIITITAVPWYGITHGYSGSLWLAAFLFWAWSGLSITAGYHRLWSHRAWQAHPALQWVFAIGGAMAMQNTIIHWCSDHRIHHKHVDNDHQDPYSAGKGFWYSHMGWLMRDHGISQTEPNNVRDLQKNPIVMFQHRHYNAIAVFTNLGMPALLGLALGDVIGAVLLVGFLRVVTVHHGTFFINSLAHIWGRQPYSDAHSSKDNGILALFTFGEGYHNFHHTFEYDYRNGIKWWQFDPTKWLIQLSSLTGLANGLRKAPQDRIETAKLKMQLRASQLRCASSKQAAEMLATLEQEYEQLMLRVQGYYSEQQRLLKLHKYKLDKKARKQLDELRQTVREHQSQWQQLRQQVHAMA
ncbi:acyl-CoA desaturase [Ferrimonas lipolytica]|uniref:Acyl-CoA desaturase n=1 Tax=Ferrimonas lipolytica TaxID=2724191 RepID=A0A6H1UJD6_9GAMM|nr:fatty acid desaturase [Ferrimonas lipolytica]QIZ78423.1 acyl-CoA desaturase [Ferrimonas lipolytica]